MSKNDKHARLEGNIYYNNYTKHINDKNKSNLKSYQPTNGSYRTRKNTKTSNRRSSSRSDSRSSSRSSSNKMKRNNTRSNNLIKYGYRRIQGNMELGILNTKFPKQMIGNPAFNHYGNTNLWNSKFMERHTNSGTRKTNGTPLLSEID